MPKTRRKVTKTKKIHVGRWEMKECQIFQNCMEIIGSGCYEAYQKYLPKRSLLQIRSHAQKFLHKKGLQYKKKAQLKGLKWRTEEKLSLLSNCKVLNLGKQHCATLKQQLGFVNLQNIENLRKNTENALKGNILPAQERKNPIESKLSHQISPNSKSRQVVQTQNSKEEKNRMSLFQSLNGQEDCLDDEESYLINFFCSNPFFAHFYGVQDQLIEQYKRKKIARQNYIRETPGTNENQTNQQLPGKVELLFCLSYGQDQGQIENSKI